MSDSRMISIDELNKILAELIEDYKSEWVSAGDRDAKNIHKGRMIAIQDLYIHLNDPQSIENVSSNIQQTVAVIEAKNIINDNLNKNDL